MPVASTPARRLPLRSGLVMGQPALSPLNSTASLRPQLALPPTRLTWPLRPRLLSTASTGAAEDEKRKAPWKRLYMLCGGVLMLSYIPLAGLWLERHPVTGCWRLMDRDEGSGEQHRAQVIDAGLVRESRLYSKLPLSKSSRRAVCAMATAARIHNAAALGPAHRTTLEIADAPDGIFA